jgi:hypothetical protein
MLLSPQRANLCFDSIGVETPPLGVDHLARTIEEKKSGGTTDAIARRQLSPQRIPQADTQYLRPPFQVTL